mgnify:FL=1
MRFQGGKGYSTGYSKSSCTLSQSLAMTVFPIYKGIVYIYTIIRLSIRIHSYALHNIYNRSAIHSTLYTDE